MKFVNLCLVILSLLSLPAYLRAQNPPPLTLPLMPMPASVRMGQGRLRVNSDFATSSPGYSDPRLQGAISRALVRLGARTTFTLGGSANANAALMVRVDGPGESVQGLNEDESYSLEITPQQATLHAAAVTGAMRGLETLLQLLAADSSGFYFPALRIDDRPRFPWRGLLVDVSRHWEPVDVVKRTLDAMAVVKLNVFHWHLSDDQGFRVESKTFPRLHQLGSDGLYYTQAEIRDIVAFARDRGIRVVPEFDMPGHSHSWFIGYPQYASAPGPFEFKRYLGGDSVPFDPTRKQTYQFIDKFIGEMSRLFPDAYWHVGGDEVDGTPWDANPSIQAFKKKHGLPDNTALQLYFNRQLTRIVHHHGKQMVGWDEILNPDLPKDAVVQSWRGPESLATAAKRGYDGILSAPYYLDKMFPTSSYYAGDPIPANSDLDATQAAHILGGEACMWGELVTPENIESRIWPYTAAIAERLWSPREVNDVADMYRRMDIVSARLEEAGSRHRLNPQALLRQAAGGDYPTLIGDFINFVEPLRLGLHMDERRPDQNTPLAALGDIVVPDSPAARRFAAQVTSFLKSPAPDATLHDALKTQLQALQAMQDAVSALASHAPVFRDAEASAADLAELGMAGEQALGYLTQGRNPPPDWIDHQNALLDRAAKPKGLLRIAVLDATRQLILAAEGLKSGEAH